MSDKNPLLEEVFVFRPAGKVDFRYANRNWIPDDGEPDLAFVSNNFALYVSMPYYTNLLWEWRDRSLSESWVADSLKRDVSPWHYYTIGNEPWEDHSWDERNSHPNEIAGRLAMDKCCSLHGCANGRSVRLTQEDECIKRGQLWIKRTMEVVKPPPNPICFLCLNNGREHIIQALRRRKSHYEDALKQAQEDYQEALDYKASINSYTRHIRELEEELARLNANQKEDKGEN